jgi:hypothetical protein
MRTAAIILSAVMLTSPALSQISLTSSDAQSYFAPGKTWRFLENSNLSTTWNVGTASSSAQSWTLPTITYTDTVRMDNVLPSATPYASSFRNATHAQRAIQSSGGTTSTYYQYYNLKSDSMISLGNALRIQGAGKDTTEFTWHRSLDLLIPFTYGTAFTNRDSIPLSPGSYILQRSTQMCDAFGTFTTPAGTFQVVRKKQTIFSQTIFGGVQVSADTSVQYSFITKEGDGADVTPKDKNPTGSTISITGISYYSIISTPAGIADQGQTLPTEPYLAQNYPNPFNPSTTVQFSIPNTSFVSLKVSNVLGAEIATLVNENKAPGTYKVSWDAGGFPSGVYFYRLIAGGKVFIGKMNLLK